MQSKHINEALFILSVSQNHLLVVGDNHVWLEENVATATVLPCFHVCHIFGCWSVLVAIKDNYSSAILSTNVITVDFGYSGVGHTSWPRYAMQ